MALIKESNVDEFFEKVNWHMLFVRLHKWNLWGGKAWSHDGLEMCLHFRPANSRIP